jgi:heat shock protein HtpX
MNTFKTTLLMTILTVLFVLAGNWLGGQSGMLIAFAFAVLMNVGTYWFSDKLVLKMYGAQELDRQRYPQIYSMTEEMTGRAGIPMPKLYMIKGEQPNAFATGRNPQNAAVAVTESIVRLLSGDELRGVIAHELAHIRHRDILVATVAATMAGAISMLANMAQWAFIFGGGRSSDDDRSNPIAAIAMIIVMPLAATMVQLAISRQREFLADAGGAELSGNPLSLASALKRLHSASQQIPMNASPSTAHLFIVNPFTARGLAKLFSTHPPMEERVAKLEAMVYGGGGVR